MFSFLLLNLSRSQILTSLLQVLIFREWLSYGIICQNHGLLLQKVICDQTVFTGCLVIGHSHIASKLANKKWVFSSLIFFYHIDFQLVQRFLSVKLAR